MCNHASKINSKMRMLRLDIWVLHGPAVSSYPED
jgi:hypothetical protein